MRVIILSMTSKVKFNETSIMQNKFKESSDKNICFLVVMIKGTSQRKFWLVFAVQYLITIWDK